MVSHSLDSIGKMGSSGGHYAGGIREMGDQKQRLFKGKRGSAPDVLIDLLIGWLGRIEGNGWESRESADVRSGT
jgi:hypothetical protein